MNPNEPYTYEVELRDGKRHYYPLTPSDLYQVVLESTAPQIELYFDNQYQGTWFPKETANENN